MTADHWFKPKTHGYGAYPANWKGWAAIAGFIAAELLLVLALIAYILPQRAGGQLSIPLLAAWTVAMFALVAIFIWITWKKTDGAWRWRWGSHDT